MRFPKFIWVEKSKLASYSSSMRAHHCLHQTADRIQKLMNKSTAAGGATTTTTTTTTTATHVPTISHLSIRAGSILVVQSGVDTMGRQGYKETESQIWADVN